MAKKIKIILEILIILTAAALGYFLYQSQSTDKKTDSTSYDQHAANQKDNQSGDQTTSPEIIVDTPKPDSEIQSPLAIAGQARGSWYFEAVFPVKLLDSRKQIIAEGQARAKSDWLTTDFVPFEASLEFSSETKQNGILILQNDNPSGLPQNLKQTQIPVIILPTPSNSLSHNQQKTISVKLYYYNPNNDKDESGNILCSSKGLIAVERQIPITQTPVQDTIKMLLEGNITPKERQQGITTEFPLDGFSLKSAALNNGILTLEFNDLKNKTNGGACRAAILWKQIETTAKQFSEVNEVRFIPETLFQP